MMSEYTALVSIMQDALNKLKADREEKRMEYADVRHDPDATEDDILNARIELRCASARWGAVESIMNDLPNKVWCKQMGVSYW